MPDTPRETRPPLTIDSAELRLVRLPLLTPFVISTGTMYERVFPLLILRSGDLEGYAEGVMDPLPDYLAETIPAAMALLRELFLPMIVGKSFANPAALQDLLTPWRGHQMTKATVEMAFRDLWAKSLNLPLGTMLGGSGDSVDVGVSLGIGGIDDTVKRVADHHAQGYRRIKLKTRPGHDVALIAAVREAFPEIRLSVDANACYSLADTPMLQKLDAFDLDYIEQPLAWDDIQDHAELQKRIRTPICLDECINSVQACRQALQADAARVVNIKVARAGGYGAALRMHDLCAAFDVPVWCGGMLESGIGRAHNIHLSTLPNFSKPGDTSSASRYFARDIICEKLETRDGRMPVPQGAGIGVHLDHDFLPEVTVTTDTFAP